MSVLRNLLAGIGVVVLLAVAVFGVAWIRTMPEPLPEGTESAARLLAGPYAVGEVEFNWVDKSRPTPRNGGYPGSPERTLQVTMWYPEDADEKHPLVVYCHGFVSSRRGGTYLAEYLASYGYVTVAADFPLTRMNAPGGPYMHDVVHQPADVSFLIDKTIGMPWPFDGEIDRERIGVFGLSLGAVTSTLAGFHPDWRDRRIAAVISIAGVGDVFGPRFFDHARIPFLMIAGTADGIVDYQANALPIPDRIHDGGLVSLAGATHVGFDDLAAGWIRLFGNPDQVGCTLGGADPDAVMENPFSGLFGSAEQGLLNVAEYPTPCAKSFDSVMSAGRQQQLTKLIVRAFFDAHFAIDGKDRAESERFLAGVLPGEFTEVTFTPNRR